MPGITIIIVASVVAFFIVGIPLIVRKIRFPVDVTYAPINIDEMEGLDRAFFQKKGSKLEALGFKRAMDMSISGLIGTNNNRMFSDGKGNIALLSELSVEHGQSKKQFLRIAQGSASEMVPIFQIIHRRGIIEKSVYESMYGRLESLAKMLTNLIKSVDSLIQKINF